MKRTDRFRFMCQQCGKCCTASLPWQAVFLYTDDVLKLSRLYAMDVRKLVAEFTSVYKFHYVDNGEEFDILRLVIPCVPRCKFLAKRKCSVHEKKPIQCRLAPFVLPLWESGDTQKQPCMNCLGFGKGKIKLASEIGSCLDTHRKYEQDFFDESKDSSSLIYKWIHESVIDRIFRVELSDSIKYSVIK